MLDQTHKNSYWMLLGRVTINVRHVISYSKTKNVRKTLSGLGVKVWKSTKLLKSAQTAVRNWNVDLIVYLYVTHNMLLIVHRQECFVAVSYCTYVNESFIYWSMMYLVYMNKKRDNGKKEIFNLYIINLA